MRNCDHHDRLVMSTDREQERPGGSTEGQGPMGGLGAGVLGAGGLPGTALGGLASAVGGSQPRSSADTDVQNKGTGEAEASAIKPVRDIGPGAGAPAGSQEVPAAGFGHGSTASGTPLAGGGMGGAGADLSAAGQDAGRLRMLGCFMLCRFSSVQCVVVARWLLQ